MSELAPPAPSTSDGAPEAPPSSGLRGTIGVVGIVFLVVAAAAPLTAIGGALPVMLAIGNGAGSPTAYLVVAVVLLVFSVGYAAMSRHVVDAGAFYAYVTRGLGVPVGLGAGGLALLTYTAVLAAVYGLAGATAQGLVLQLGGPELPWWVWSFVLMAAVGTLGYRNVDVGAKVLGVVLTLEIGVIAVVAVAVIAQGGADGLDLVPFTPTAFFSGAPGISVMFAVASFIGFEATAIYAEEAREPRRTVPIATYTAVLLIGGFYAIASWAFVQAFGSGDVVAAALADPDLIFTATAAYVHPVLADVMIVLLLSSLFAALLAFHNAISRYLFSLSRRGVMPAALHRTHPRHGSPYVGSLAQTGSAVVVVGAFAVAGADPVLQLFTWMSGLATVSVLLLMALTSVSVIAFFARRDVDRRVWHTRVAPALGTVGLLGLLGLVLANFTTLIDGSGALAAVLLLVIAVAFAGGVVAAYVRRARDGVR
ncbi:APC family permease [Actinotalea sp. C106]|uniref:APC family permease n=1 Tax=Actinotalea sp. C106 TaxID=2908644 RepID=UPI002028B8C1|nr:APC family permease [Actinotalea sp. C106]